MTFEYNGTRVFYRIVGKGTPCLLLHGWGCDGEIFEGLTSNFSCRQFIIVDFPPFGKSGQNIVDWNIFTYANMVLSLCEMLEIKNCDVLGHSFGGRVAILLSALRPELVRSLVLVDSAGLKPRHSIKYFFKVYGYKILKNFGLEIKNAGSEDYRNLSPEHKKVFVSVVNTFLDEYCKNIKSPTLIIFGKKDFETPIYMAKRFKKLIDGSNLILLDDAGHYCFLDCPLSFYRHLQEFWEGL